VKEGWARHLLAEVVVEIEFTGHLPFLKIVHSDLLVQVQARHVASIDLFGEAKANP
jgi:hypothetical protein